MESWNIGITVNSRKPDRVRRRRSCQS